MTDRLIKIAGVRFPENWKVHDFDASDVDVAVGDKVIVDSDRGLVFAQVMRLRRTTVTEAAEEPGNPELEKPLDGSEEELPGTPPAPAAPRKTQKGLRKIVRKATEEDLARQEKNRAREAEAYTVAQDMMVERELPMKLIRVEYSYDSSRATFFFFSENRVDFRDLVKDLAFKLKSRIEMRQIGVRDVARMIGGFGPCGRELCCASHLKNFEPVSIRMAKKQEMVLNPAKISGVCGRLLCCLSYEFEMYDEIKKDLAGMRAATVKEKKEEEEQRIAEERREAEERRTAEEKQRQEDRRQREDQRREKQKETVQKGGKPEKKREPREKKAPRPPREAQPPRGRQQQPPRPEKEQPKAPEQEQEQDQTQQPQQEGDSAGKKKRRRFWRRKKKGSQQGENKPQGPATS